MKTFLFLDMEFSGLDPAVNRPLEIAMVATDEGLHRLGEYQSVFYWEDIVFNDWSEKSHAANGLLDVIQDGKECHEIDAELCSFVKSLPGDIVLAGQSVYVDRAWINKYLPTFASKLNHRMLDITTMDMMFEGLGRSIKHRANTHRALDDARAALSAAKHYSEALKSHEAQSYDSCL
jgi:oligoribonuclease